MLGIVTVVYLLFYGSVAYDYNVICTTKTTFCNDVAHYEGN